jgi:hypothetical protein
MPNTTNFNWTTPADTDLVKDGAAAIRTLGNGIDTSLVDLKGGTTGQVLSKATNTDLDYTWVTPNVGDITEVQAGTGISIASGTGPIPVVTNTVATAIDAKGDLIVGTGADTFARLAVGTNDFVLTAASGETTGLKWAAVPAPVADFKGFSAYLNTSQTPTAGVNTKLAFSGENFDTEGWYDAATNYRFTPTTAGYYKIDVMVMANSTGRCRINLYKNGSEITRCFDYQPAANLQGTYSAPFYSNGTDYWEVYIFQAATSGAMQLGLDLSVFSATYLGA